jgi:general secretion pathway protein G
MKIPPAQDRLAMRSHRYQRTFRFRSARCRVAGLLLSRDGFSLIEVMIVVVILAILATLLAPHVMGRTDDAKRAAAKAQIKNIENALQLYKLDNGAYPSNEQGLKALVEKPSSEPRPANWKAGGYLAKLPSDPWGRVYAYSTPGKQGEFEIVSLGADGTPGGEGKNADLNNWELEKN